MNISAKDWQNYIDLLRKVDDKATELLENYLNDHGLPRTPAQVDKLIEFAKWISDKYGEAASELAAQMYDAVATVSKKVLPSAVPAPTPTFDEVRTAVLGTLKTENTETIAGAIGRLVKQTGVDTTMQNALRDGAEWAWIPRGDTCAFCITLASRGWQTASKKAIRNGHAEHIHANCDCTYAVRFDSDMNVEGYDPDEYLRMYYDAPLEEWNTPDGKPPKGHLWSEAPTPKNRINAMRREIYAENKDKINAQKRDAYEKQKERESSRAEEKDV